MLALDRPIDHPRVSWHSRRALQLLDGGLAEMHDLGARLGIGQAQGPAGDIDVVPFQGHDLAKATAGQDQQPHGKDGRWQFDPLGLHLAQHLANPPQLGGTEEAFALFLGVFADVLARIGAVRAQAPHLGKVEHLGDHFQTAVGLIGNVAQIVMKLGHVSARDLGHQTPAEGGQDETPQIAPVFPGGAGFEPDRDVLRIKALGHFPDRHGRASVVAVRRRVLAITRRGDDLNGAVACLCAGQHGAGPKRHPPRSPPGPVLHHIAFASAGQDPQAKAGNVAVPEEVFARLWISGVDDALGQFGHGGAAPFCQVDSIWRKALLLPG